MTGHELYTNPDHRVWAAEFCRIARDKGFDPANADDDDWLASWIANAMMHGWDRATGFSEIAHAMLADGVEPPGLAAAAPPKTGSDRQ